MRPSAQFIFNNLKQKPSLNKLNKGSYTLPAGNQKAPAVSRKAYESTRLQHPEPPIFLCNKDRHQHSKHDGKHVQYQ